MEELLKAIPRFYILIYLLLIVNPIIAQERLNYKEIDKVSKPIGKSLLRHRNINHPDATFVQDIKKSVCKVYFYSPVYNKLVSGSAFLVNTVNNSFASEKKIYLMTVNHNTFPVGINLLESTTPHQRKQIYLSFDFEVSNPILKGFNEIDSFEASAIKRLWRVDLLPLVQDKDSDIALYEIIPYYDDPDNLFSANDSEIFEHVYAAGWSLNINSFLEEYRPKDLFTLIGHPRGDLKKIMSSPNNSFWYETGIRDPNQTANPENGSYKNITKDKELLFTLRKEKFNPEHGSSGSPLFNTQKKVIGLLSAGSAKYASTILKNSWLDLPILTGQNPGYLQNFLDPDKTWISSIPGGYLKDLIQNDPETKFDLEINTSGINKIINLYAANFFGFNKDKTQSEFFLGDGIFIHPDNLPINNKITLTLEAPGNRKLYEVYYNNSINQDGVFKGKSPLVFTTNFPFIKRRDFKNNIIKYMKLKGSTGTDLKILNSFKIENANISLKTNSGKAKVRAIKLPYQMPYNAKELFEPGAYDNLWSSYKYKPSRGKDSKNLYIKEIKIEIDQYLPPDKVGGNCKKLERRVLKTIKTDNNGGYLNLVNPNYQIDDIFASQNECPETEANRLIITVKTNNSQNKHYGAWIDYFKHKKGGVQTNPEDNYTYNFKDDPTEHIAEQLVVNMTDSKEIVFSHVIPKISDLIEEFKNDTIKTRLRVAVATQPVAGRDNLTQDGNYEQGEVEDYLVNIRNLDCKDRTNILAVLARFIIMNAEDLYNDDKSENPDNVSEDTDNVSENPDDGIVDNLYNDSDSESEHNDFVGECRDSNTCSNIILSSGNNTTYNFNNTDSYIDVNTNKLFGNIINYTMQKLTVSFYIYVHQAAEVNTPQYIFSLGDDNKGIVLRQKEGKIQLGMASNDTNAGDILIESTNDIPMDQWVNITMVYDGINDPNVADDGIVKLRINDTEVSGPAPNALSFSNTTNIETTFADATNSTLLNNTFIDAPTTAADIISFNGGLAKGKMFKEIMSKEEIDYFNCDNNFPIPSFGTSSKSSAGNSEKEIIADNLSNLDKEDEKKVPDFSIFPNPAKEELNIMVEVQQAGPVQINIYDMSSRKVFTKSWPNIEQGHQLITLRKLNLSPGNYILKISAGNVRRSEKVVFSN